jgi:integrase
LRKEGIVDPKHETYASHAGRTLLDHVDDWVVALRSRQRTEKHVDLHSTRAMRVIALFQGAELARIEPERSAKRERIEETRAELRKWVATARLAGLTAENVQRALGRLIEAGRSYQTANHHRAAIRAFSRWLFETYRTREPLRGVAGYNVKEDPRHERRTVSLEDLRRLIAAAEKGAPYKGMTGPMRALCYRLAVASGLRYQELGSIKPESFDWKARPVTVTVRAAYAKNGQTVTLPLPDDLAADLAGYVASLPTGAPIFPLVPDKGAPMLRIDLSAAQIAYKDAAGLVFDFHSLRCELATLADAAGVSPRVVQRMMRHSTLELTGKYTRPRVADLDAAAGMLPSLKHPGDAGATAGATKSRVRSRKVSGGK